MTHLGLTSYRRRAALPAPACGAVPRRVFWKLAFSAICAGLALAFWAIWNAKRS